MAPTALARKEFHDLIDSIQDDALLEAAYQLLYSLNQGNVDIIDQLSPAQQKRLYASIAQADAGETFSLDVLKKDMARWLTK